MSRMNKAELIHQSEEHQEAIERELALLAAEGKKMARTAAYVSGGLLAAYLIVKLITRDKKEASGEQQGFIQSAAPVKSAGFLGGFGKFLLTEAAMFGLQMAKKRIKDILTDDKTTED